MEASITSSDRLRVGTLVLNRSVSAQNTALADPKFLEMLLGSLQEERDPVVLSIEILNHNLLVQVFMYLTEEKLLQKVCVCAHLSLSLLADCFLLLPVKLTETLGTQE